MAEVLELSDDIENKFIRQFIFEAGIKTPKYRNLVFDYLKSFVNKKELVLKTMQGIKLEEINRAKRDYEQSLVDLVSEESDFLADPMPNLYFTRDPFASAGNGIILNKMYSVTRNRKLFMLNIYLTIILIIRDKLINIMTDIYHIILKAEMFLILIIIY